jgi:ubiquinone/menaquinone biosynthesis C-methylase UbiE
MYGPILDEARQSEHQKYFKVYKAGTYGMNGNRFAQAVASVEALPCRGGYLDVSCGRGEMLRTAHRLGFDPVMGTEIVPQLLSARVVRAEVHDLPFKDSVFDVVTMFDVIEHLIPGDDELACKELERVARKHVLVAANNSQSRIFYEKNGKRERFEELHINVRPYEEWDHLFRQWFSGAVTWISQGLEQHSETWRIDL